MTPQKKIYINELLTGGFVTGLLYSLQVFGSYLMNGQSKYNWVFIMYGIAVLAGCQIYFGRRVAALKDVNGKGYTYLNGLGFSIKMMLLSGIVFGFASWLLQTVIEPAYGELLTRNMVQASLSTIANPTEDQISSIKSMTAAMMTIWGMIGLGMFSLLLNGGFVALITSAFVKRQPNIFTQND